jgi:hypothetical protein
VAADSGHQKHCVTVKAGIGTDVEVPFARETIPQPSGAVDGIVDWACSPWRRCEVAVYRASTPKTVCEGSTSGRSLTVCSPCSHLRNLSAYRAVRPTLAVVGEASVFVL